jgi:hypothetical protein
VHEFKVIDIQWIENDPYVIYFKPYTLNPSLTYNILMVSFLQTLNLKLFNYLHL